MAESPMQSKLKQMNEAQRKRVEQALKDGLTGRKALLRAYESITERVKDTETQSMLRKFATEEQAEFNKAKEILERYGIETTVADGVKNEVVAFFSKTMLHSGEGPYADLRDLTMLHGAEQAANLGARPLEGIAEAMGDHDWKDAIKQSRQRSEAHSSYIQDRVEHLGREAFGSGR